MIRAVLPGRRRSRKESWRRFAEHVVAGVFLVSGLALDFNLRRLERYVSSS